MNPERTLDEIARRLARWRREAHLTLQQLGDRSGVAPSTIHKVETGKTIPTVAVVIKIARGLGRRPSDVVADEAAEFLFQRAGSHDAIELDTNLSVEQLCERSEIWRIHHRCGGVTSEVDAIERAGLVLVCEDGGLQVRAGERAERLEAGDTLRVENAEHLLLETAPHEEARFLVIGHDCRGLRTTTTAVAS